MSWGHDIREFRKKIEQSDFEAYRNGKHSGADLIFKTQNGVWPPEVTQEEADGLSFTLKRVGDIQITKGAGSVVNGYESISGQINTELLKPVNDIPFFLNAYGPTDSRFELNTHFNTKISDKWARYSLFVHGNARTGKNDMNEDGFLDNPLGKQINVLNRWQYTDAQKGWVGFVNFRYMNDEKQTGEMILIPTKTKGRLIMGF